MKKNGFTLIELLAALAISGIVLTIISSILVMGIKQGEVSKNDVALQQEANYVANVLRKEYLSTSVYNTATQYILTVTSNQIILNGQVISDQYQYDSLISYEETTPFVTGQEVVVSSNSPVKIQITFTKGNKSYTLRTTLSRGV